MDAHDAVGHVRLNENRFILTPSSGLTPEPVMRQGPSRAKPSLHIALDCEFNNLGAFMVGYFFRKKI